MRHYYDCGTIVIASSGSNSTEVDADPHYQNARGLLIEAPDTLTGTITVQVSLDGGSSFSNLQRAGADITIAAGDVEEVEYKGWDVLRVSSGSAEGGARTFVVNAYEDF